MSEINNSVCSVNELKDKEVINICDGKKLGYICDVTVDLCSGRLTCIIVPAPGRFIFGCSKHCDIVIPWEHIERIGDDTILVKYVPPVRDCEDHPNEKRHRFF